MEKYKCVNNKNYEHELKIGGIYSGEVVPGIFANRRYLRVYDDTGETEITTAHLSRFEKLD